MTCSVNRTSRSSGGVSSAAFDSAAEARLALSFCRRHGGHTRRCCSYASRSAVVSAPARQLPTSREAVSQLSSTAIIAPDLPVELDHVRVPGELQRYLARVL